jgi:phage-related minor tail protein
MKTGMGLMGEAGAEAIMPLTRASNGDLGVKVVGQRQTSEVDVHIHNEGGEDMKVTKSQARTNDLGKMIVDVWIDAHHNNKYGLRSYMGG